MKNYQTYFASGLAFILMTTLVPLKAEAQWDSGYEPRTQEELIAYIHGRIAQLMEIKRLVDEGKTLQQAAEQTQVNMVVIETHSADEILATRAVLRGEVLLYGKATASAWFEYGKESDFLDQRTSYKWVNGAYDRAVRIEANNLEPDERYYFRLVTENNDKTVSYGKVYQFHTDEIDD